MSEVASCLRTLHRIHRQLTDLRGRLDRGPRRVRAKEAVVAQATAALEEAKELQKAARMRSDQKQLSLKTSEAKIEELKVKLNGCKSNKEYQALREQIAAAEMANSVLADEILEQMERVDELAKSIAEAETARQAALAAAEQAKREVAAEAGSLQSDVARLEGELTAEEAKLPTDVMDNYRRVVSVKGEDALAALEEGACTVCFQQVTANMMNELTLGRAVVCKSCGALLYLPADHSAATRQS